MATRFLQLQVIVGKYAFRSSRIRVLKPNPVDGAAAREIAVKGNPSICRRFPTTGRIGIDRGGVLALSVVPSPQDSLCRRDSTFSRGYVQPMILRKAGTIHSPAAKKNIGP